MSVQSSVAPFYKGWDVYQGHLVRALAPLTAGQLALRAAPGLRSIGELALHIVGCRSYWFTQFLGEDWGEAMQVYQRWNALALTVRPPVPSAAELVLGLERTGHCMAECLARWTPADMQQTFPDEPVEVSRQWVVWHVLEHDLHHGGELSLTLGIHGLAAPDL